MGIYNRLLASFSSYSNDPALNLSAQISSCSRLSLVWAYNQRQNCWVTRWVQPKFLRNQEAIFHSGRTIYYLKIFWKDLKKKGAGGGIWGYGMQVLMHASKHCPTELYPQITKLPEHSTFSSSVLGPQSPAVRCLLGPLTLTKSLDSSFDVYLLLIPLYLGPSVPDSALPH